RQAKTVANQLGQAMGTVVKRKYDGAASMNFLDPVARHNKGVAWPSWDEAAQVYVAIDAIYRAQTDLDPQRHNPRRRDQIRALGSQLELPYDPATKIRHDSPQDFDPAKFEEALQTIWLQK